MNPGVLPNSNTGDRNPRADGSWEVSSIKIPGGAMRMVRLVPRKAVIGRCLNKKRPQKEVLPNFSSLNFMAQFSGAGETGVFS